MSVASHHDRCARHDLPGYWTRRLLRQSSARRRVQRTLAILLAVESVVDVLHPAFQLVAHLRQHRCNLGDLSMRYILLGDAELEQREFLADRGYLLDGVAGVLADALEPWKNDQRHEPAHDGHGDVKEKLPVHHHSTNT